MFPLPSTCTRITSPHRPPFMLLGSIGQPSTRRYGLGRSAGFGYAGSCALDGAPRTENVASKVKSGKWKVESKFKVISLVTLAAWSSSFQVFLRELLVFEAHELDELGVDQQSLIDPDGPRPRVRFGIIDQIGR